MYFFPKSSFGAERKWTVSEKSSRQQEMSQQEYLDYGASVESFMGTPTLQELPSAYGELGGQALFSKGKGGAKGNQFPTLALCDDTLNVTLLTEKAESINKSLKLCELLMQRACNSSTVSTDAETATASMLELMQQLEVLRGEVQFAAKFKKVKMGGDSLTNFAISQFVAKADSLIASTLQKMKIVKALL